MVSTIKETHQPHYLLDDIRQATQRGNFRYEGRKVNTDIRNLRYTNEDVKRCISGLVSGQFQKCLHYENAVYDAYICEYQQTEDSTIDKIYLKLRLLATGEVHVGIGSFHLA